MKANSVHILSAMLVAGAVGFTWHARAGSELVKFPENYGSGVHYATINRGNIREEIFTSQEAVEL